MLHLQNSIFNQNILCVRSSASYPCELDKWLQVSGILAYIWCIILFISCQLRRKKNITNLQNSPQVRNRVEISSGVFDMGIAALYV